MIRRYAVTFIILLFSLNSVHSQKVPSQRPKLLLFILVDQLNTEQIVAFRDQFSDNGFNRLINGGSFFRNTSHAGGSSYMGTNLATIATGAHPSTHGIISDWWFDQIRSKEVHAAYGDIVNIKEGIRQYPSTQSLMSSTITDELKWMTNGKARVASIGLNQDHLIWSAGHNPDYIYELNNSSGDFDLVQSTDSALTAPTWVKKFNRKDLLSTYSNREWGPVKDLNQYYQMRFFSDERSNNHAFIYSLAKQEGDRAYIPVIHSPYGNKIIRDFAMSQIINEEYGQDNIPDILTLHFTSRTVHGKQSGMFSAETQDMLLRLDMEIADILKTVDDEVGLENTLVALTSIAAPQRNLAESQKHKIPTGVFSGEKAASLTNLFLMAKYGQGKWVMTYNDAQLYLNHKLIEERKVDLKEIKQEAADFLSDMQGIAYAVPVEELNYSASDINSLKSLKLNYYPNRSGDIAIKIRPGWYEELNDGKKINRAWSASHLPLIFFGWKVNPQNVYQAISATRIAPTICSFLEIPFPNGCESEPLPGLTY